MPLELHDIGRLCDDSGPPRREHQRRDLPGLAARAKVIRTVVACLMEEAAAEDHQAGTLEAAADVHSSLEATLSDQQKAYANKCELGFETKQCKHIQNR